jgi:hypothetical protein
MMLGDSTAATGNKAFDQQFVIRTVDPALARALIGPALVAEHLTGRIPYWTLTGHDLPT